MVMPEINGIEKRTLLKAREGALSSCKTILNHELKSDGVSEKLARFR